MNSFACFESTENARRHNQTDPLPRRAVARRVLLAVPPPGDPERRPLARSRAGADIRLPHGVHPVRNHRCRCPAELARATGGAERRWHRAMAMSGERHRALEILAGSSLGCTEAMSVPGERRHPSAGAAFDPKPEAEEI
jgi:hypothetical protein